MVLCPVIGKLLRKRVVLASASPRRREILNQACTFSCLTSMGVKDTGKPFGLWSYRPEHPGPASLMAAMSSAAA